MCFIIHFHLCIKKTTSFLNCVISYWFQFYIFCLVKCYFNILLPTVFPLWFYYYFIHFLDNIFKNTSFHCSSNLSFCFFIFLCNSLLVNLLLMVKVQLVVEWWMGRCLWTDVLSVAECLVIIVFCIFKYIMLGKLFRESCSHISSNRVYCVLYTHLMN